MVRRALVEIIYVNTIEYIFEENKIYSLYTKLFALVKSLLLGIWLNI
jgi:hypothetical protein